jgi:hypothetical protein
MTLDDLMAVWKSQDSAPLHGVNETLLRLALRKDEAKLQREWRLGRRIIYVGGAVWGGHLAFFLFLMTRHNQTVWDYTFPIVGVAAVLLLVAVVRSNYRTPALLKQSFDVSLRDQLNRQIAQFDYTAKKHISPSFLLAHFLPMLVGSIAIFFTVLRSNGDPISDAWIDARSRLVLIGMVVFQVVAFVGGFWASRRIAKRKYVPHKQRLETLLKELDGQ